ncbi:hypothetical protein SAMN02746019_00002620, partial [Thermoflexus hugenholtzii JAD2]
MGGDEHPLPPDEQPDPRPLRRLQGPMIQGPSE